MTEEQRKEGILKQCKGLPSVVEKYIDFLIEKINKLVKENRRFAKHIIELQKENKELKEKYKQLDNLEGFTFETYKSFKLDVKELARLFESRGYRLDSVYQENIKLQDQLTKAKEHIRTLTSCLIADAEQFLKEIEK